MNLARNNPDSLAESGPGYLLFKGILPPDEFESQLLNIARKFGRPSVRDGGKAVWKVQPSKSIGTFSETAGEASYHTDSQYHDKPEALFLLACLVPAEDGGDTRLLSKADVMSSLRAASFKPADYEKLRAPIWRWRVPDVFLKDDQPGLSSPKPILSPDGYVAWRFDNLVCPDAEAEHVAYRFHDAIAAHPPSAQFSLRPGDVLVCCNRTVLHARTAFTDPKRVFFRVRVS